MKKIFFVFTLLALAAFGSAQAQTWTPAPAGTPPTCPINPLTGRAPDGCYSPINASLNAQAKPGSLSLGTTTLPAANVTLFVKGKAANVAALNLADYSGLATAKFGEFGNGWIATLGGAGGAAIGGVTPFGSQPLNQNEPSSAILGVTGYVPGGYAGRFIGYTGIFTRGIDVGLFASNKTDSKLPTPLTSSVPAFNNTNNSFAAYFDGPVAIDNGTAQPNYILKSVDTFGRTEWVDPATIVGPGTSFWTKNASNNIYNNNTGTKVGINNANPSATLDVGGLTRVNGTNWPSSGQGLELAWDSYSQTAFIQPYNRGTGSWGKLYLGSGNVGIGTTGPDAKLHVVGTGKFSDNVGIGSSPVAGNRLHILEPGSGGNTLILDSSDKADLQFAKNGVKAFGLTYNSVADIYGPSGLVFGLSDGSNKRLLTISSESISGASIQGLVKIDAELQIVGGRPGAGKVLTSDANGWATWQNSSGGSSVNKNASLSGALYAMPTNSLDLAAGNTGRTSDMWWCADSYADTDLGPPCNVHNQNTFTVSHSYTANFTGKVAILAKGDILGHQAGFTNFRLRGNSSTLDQGSTFVASGHAGGRSFTLMGEFDVVSGNTYRFYVDSYRPTTDFNNLPNYGEPLYNVKILVMPQ